MMPRLRARSLGVLSKPRGNEKGDRAGACFRLGRIGVRNFLVGDLDEKKTHGRGTIKLPAAVEGG